MSSISRIIDNSYQYRGAIIVELQEVISLRRSIKKFKHDMVINDEDVFKAIEQATDAPNHGMREPWRVIHVSKDRLEI